MQPNGETACFRDKKERKKTFRPKFLGIIVLNALDKASTNSFVFLREKQLSIFFVGIFCAKNHCATYKLTKIPLKALDVSKGLNLIFAIRRILILN
jgi:hypothetical protein